MTASLLVGIKLLAIEPDGRQAQDVRAEDRIEVVAVHIDLVSHKDVDLRTAIQSSNA